MLKPVKQMRINRRRRIKYLLILLFFFDILPFKVIGQRKIFPDTIRFKQVPAALVFYTDFRNSFVFSDFKNFFKTTTPVTVYGGAVGLEFKGQHQYTIGVYTLSKVAKQRVAENALGLTQLNQKWNLTFASLAYTYTFFEKNKWELKVPFELGLGKGSIKVYDNLNNVFYKVNGIFIPFQMGFISEYKLTKYFGIQASLGYRKTVIGSIFKRSFDSPYYSIGLTFYYNNIWSQFKKIIAKKEEVEEKLEEKQNDNKTKKKE